ncbi:MAG: S8 family serine peptidase [Streptosporangiaceae bacterium]|nr:S8 family serine peptidase [Streptosporangiaceae bacterium]MBV9857005.1 S8 family serine peptidase [Streptosporangiaceae bacterium]
MPVDQRLRAQIQLILDSLDDAAAFPDPQRWDAVDDVDYLYRKNAVLVREPDADRLVTTLTQSYGPARGADAAAQPPPFERRPVTRGVLGVTLPPHLPPVPDVLDGLDRALGPGVATPDHVLYVCPYACPAAEPAEVPAGTVNPVPPAGTPRPECDGHGVMVSIVDTGLLPGASARHSWLTGVDGVPEDAFAPGTGYILPYAGHGTFAAGCMRCAAPKASAYVERAFDIAGANYESRLAPSLEDALSRNPDVLEFTFTTSSRGDRPLHTFDDIYESSIRPREGLVVVAPAGNDGKSRRMWPAAYPWVVSVGALSADWRSRASFSNFGAWVDVFAPGEDLVNAYADGTYVCNEPPVGEHRKFQGMAMWSGTSFSTPIVAGLIAGRMSATGENGRQAAAALLKLAGSQAIPGVGAVLYPGDACR